MIMRFMEITKLVKEVVIMGYFFTVLGDMIKTFVSTLPRKLKVIKYFVVPITSCVVVIDNTKWLRNHWSLSKYHGGYLIIVQKPVGDSNG